jgi:hypothetical protein
MTMVVRTFLMLVLGLTVGTPTSFAQADKGYCAFEVAVRSPGGAAIPSLVVSALQNGRSFATAQTNAEGIVRICDVPPGQIDVEVGGHTCGAVSVRFLNPDWMKTRRVAVTFERCSEGEFYFPGGCFIIYRVQDVTGQPIFGAVFDLNGSDSARFDQTRIADAYGRIFRFIKTGEEMDVRVEKSGYASREITNQCKPGDPAKQERIITLDRLQNR